MTNDIRETIEAEGYQTGPVAILQTVYGPITVTFSGKNFAYASVGGEQGTAHLNDNRPALVYRKEEYIGGVRLSVADDGFTGLAQDERPHLSRRSDWKDAPRTYVPPMVRAITDAVQDYVIAHPEVVREAARAEVNRKLLSAYTLEDEARKAFEAAREAREELEGRWVVEKFWRK